MQTFEWRPFLQLDPEHLRNSRSTMHHAVQNVAAIGRKFLPQSSLDQNGTMIWVPGLSRMAGRWVEGDVIFRSSLCLESFEVILVDKKVSTLASFPLEGKTYSQLLIWLEEQIGKFGLDATNLAMNLPYTIPHHAVQDGAPFHQEYSRAAIELSKFYHNTYLELKRLREQFDKDLEINIWPNRFDISMHITLKDTGDPETDTRIAFGMSPGDQNFENPYFYVSTWPYTDIAQCTKLANNALWMSEEWTGAVLLSKHVYNGDQQMIVRHFFEEASDQLIKLLLD